MKKNLLLIAILFSGLLSYSQSSNNLPIHLKSGTQFFKTNINEYINSDEKETIIQNKYYKFVQFNNIPSQETKEQMISAGMKFIEYIPLNTYLVSFPKDFNKTLLLSFDIKSVIEIKNEDRITDWATNLPYPEWAMEEDNVVVYLSFYDDLNFNSCVEKLGEEIIHYNSKNATGNKVLVTINPDDLYSLLKYDFIRLIDLTPEPGKPEHELSRNMHRSSMVLTRYNGGKKYDGTGVVVVDNDDGIVGPHIDFKGRMTQPNVTLDLGTHGDMTAGIIAGSGNLDPTMGGMAPGSDIIIQQYSSSLPNTVSFHTNDSAVIFSSSYSNGCNAGYTTLARLVDQEIRQNPTMIQVFSAGNSNNSDCGYGAGNQWGNITGGHKQGKNVIATANLENNMTLANSSSRGPADDGRIKPDIAAHGNGNFSTAPNNTYARGSGTSAACPSISGVMAQMYNAYQVLNGTRPESGLMKAIILNTAEDFGNVGPDFRFGWGRVHALRAINAIETNRYFSSSISNGGNNSHSIVIPNNVKEVKVMVYWHDYEGSTSATRALVNNLDIEMELGATSFLPWVLDAGEDDTTTTQRATSLNLPAAKGVDSINNVEQVSIVNPASGTYTLKVNGTSIPQGPQKYFVTYEFIYDELTLVNPSGGEGFVPGETERIFWDAYGNSGTFTLSYSLNNGTTWSTIGTSAATARYRDWVVPNTVSGNALVKIERGTISDISDHTFTIIDLPTNLTVTKVCPSYMEVVWSPVSGAGEYQVFLLGNKYMDSVGRTTDTTFQIPLTNVRSDQWFSVSAITTSKDGNIGRRQIAEYYPGGLLNCSLPTDVSVTSLVSPNNQACISGNENIIVEVYNNGNSLISNIPIKYQINGGTVVSGIVNTALAPASTFTYIFPTPYNFSTAGTYPIKIWTELPGDVFIYNDTISFDYEHTNVQSIPFIENFNSFNNCSTDNDCEAVTCDLRNGFKNYINNEEDDIDWRVNSGSTISSGTGPSGDHTSGSSRYIYIEASGVCSQKTASFTSPCILIDRNDAALTFWYHMYGVNVDSLSVDIFDGTIWHNDQLEISGNKGNQWLKATVQLTAYFNKTIKVRINGRTGTNYLSDIAIDDFGIDEYVSLEEDELNNSISIYPNPNNGEFKINIDNASINLAEVQVFDIYGRLIFSNSISEKQSSIDLTKYSSGVYTVKISANNLSTTKKVIIN